MGTSSSVRAWRLAPGARILVTLLGVNRPATVTGVSRVDGAVIVRYRRDDGCTGSSRVAFGHAFEVAR